MNSSLFFSQWKRVWIPLLVFTIVSFVLVFFELFSAKALSDYTVRSPHSTAGFVGAGTALFSIMIIGGTMILSLVFIIISMALLFCKEFDRGYIGAYLSLPISKKTIFITKIMVIFVSLLIYHVISFVAQEAMFARRLLDYNLQVGLVLFQLNVSMLFSALLFLSVTGMLVLIFKSQSAGISIASAILAISAVFYLVGSSPDASQKTSLLRYVSILAFDTNPFFFDLAHPIKHITGNDSWTMYYPLLAQKWYVPFWQLVSPIVVACALMAGNGIIFRDKSFSI